MPYAPGADRPATMGGAAAAVLLAGLASGCLPHAETDRPEIAGTVVDGGGRPLARIPVAVCGMDGYGWVFENCSFLDAASTDARGRFRVEELTHWTVYVLRPDASRPRQAVVAACDGGHAAAAVHCEGRDDFLRLQVGNKAGNARVVATGGCRLDKDMQAQIGKAVAKWCAEEPEHKPARPR